MGGYLVLGVVVVGLLIVMGMYNGLVARKNQVQNVYASLDAMLQKRYDLVPNLVAAVQGYMTHERELLESVVKLRQAAVTGSSARARGDADEQMTSALGQLFMLSENYPQLKASDNFLHLQASLNEIEEQISAARRAFNASVTDYNNAVQMFPSSIMAGMMGYKSKQWFEIADEQRQNPNLAGQF
ncbi:MAG TPA: LemA family protein [Abditibacteriaceae bacterium]|jgi:LemA protein